MKDYVIFLDLFFEQIKNVGLDVSGLKLDHIAYQASSKLDYDNTKIKFNKLGREVNEEVIGGRRVSIFELSKPLIYKEHEILVLELIEDKNGQVCESALQHAEFIYPKSFENLINKYPNINWDISSMNRTEFAHLKLNFNNGLTLKFLHAPILAMFEDKIN